MLSLSKATAFIWSITAINADCPTIRVATVIEVSWEAQQWASPYCCSAKSHWNDCLIWYSNGLIWNNFGLLLVTGL